MEPKRILGIDLGGCMSGNSAYVYADIHHGKITIIETFKEPKHKDYEACQKFLIDACHNHDMDAIAIDAPLSLPLALVNPDAPQLPREGSGEIVNPYLFRYTDYYLFKTFGLRPMPPAGDRIGRLTARAVALLHRLNYNFPYMTINHRKIPLYETYPKQIAQHLGIAGYKQHPGTVFEKLQLSLFDFDEHLVDALLCAYGGYRILDGHTIQPPEGIENEGWCFPVL